MFYIVGSSGLLSKQLQKILKNKKFFLISSKKKNRTIFSKIFKKRINEKWVKRVNKNDTVIFLSNLGNIDFYNKNKKKVKKFQKNIINNLLLKLDKNVRFIFFSSDMVYSGKNKKGYNDHSKASPINNYGKSKALLESKIKKIFKNFLILRLSKVYSTKKDHNTFLSQLSEVKKNLLFSDQKVHYLNYIDLEKILKKILKQKNLRGVYNVPGKEFSTRYNFVKKYLNKIENKKIKIFPISIKYKKNIPNSLKLKTNLFKKIYYQPRKVF